MNKETKNKINSLDRLAIDTVVLTFHAYNQRTNGEPEDFSKESRRAQAKVFDFLGVEFVHLPKPKETYYDRFFFPFDGRTGALDWGDGNFLAKKRMAGMVGLDKKKKIITLSFRGSQQNADWLNNFNPGLKKADFLSFHGWMHAGYVNVFLMLQKEMEEAFAKALEDLQEIEEYTFVLCGHSFGGSLAELSSAWLMDASPWKKLIPKEKVHLITFGAPVIGMSDKGHDYAAWFGKRIKNAKRFVRQTDISPFLSRIAKFTWEKGRYLPRYLKVRPSPVGERVTLPSFGAKKHQWFSAHYFELYRKAIYEALDEAYRPLTRLKFFGEIG